MFARLNRIRGGASLLGLWPVQARIIIQVKHNKMKQNHETI